MKSKILLIFGINVVVLFSVKYLENNYIIKIDHYFNEYNNQLDSYEIRNIYSLKKDIIILEFISIPTSLLTKVGLISLIFYVMINVFKGKSVLFRNIFFKILISFGIFTFFSLVRLILLIVIEFDKISEINNFYPGSALSMFDPSQVQNWLLYPLQAFNIFELGFWLLLAWQLKEYFEGDFTESFKNVALGYGSSYVVWVLFVMFLTLNYS